MDIYGYRPRLKLAYEVVRLCQKKKDEGFKTPVSEAFNCNLKSFNKDDFFTIARTAGFDVFKRKDVWFEKQL